MGSNGAYEVNTNGLRGCYDEFDLWESVFPQGFFINNGLPLVWDLKVNISHGRPPQVHLGGVLAAWERPEFNYYFTAPKPLDHLPFWKQAMKQPAGSPKVTMGGGANSNVCTMRDGGPDTSFNL